MGEFDSKRTYAIRKLQFALISSAGQPLSLHPSADDALGSFVRSHGGIILDEASREMHFRALLKAKYKICPAFAWCRVDQENPILKLPKEKRHDDGKRKASPAKRARAKAPGRSDRDVSRGRKKPSSRKSD